MQVHRDINNLPSFTKAVITIGTFDGVHTGHVQILNQLNKEAAEINGETVIITFHPHPRLVMGISEIKRPEVSLSLLNTLDEKIELMAKQGIDHLVIVPFTVAFSEQTAEEYVKDFLVNIFHPHTIIIGYDHHFGKQRKGNYKLLEKYADEFNYKVKEIPEHVLNHTAVSSTKIREAILQSDLDTASKYLGYDYFFKGEVTDGDKIGRTIGYPTANLLIRDEHKLVPGNGIYAVELIICNKQLALSNKKNLDYSSGVAHLKGMMSIGFRPTIGGTKRKIEVNIFDFDETVYGYEIKVFLKKYLREEVKFNSLEELKAQIDKDKIESIHALSGKT